jgi:predicted Zn-dependent peptidase
MTTATANPSSAQSAIQKGLKNLHTATLSNGMTLWVNPMPNAPRLAMYLFMPGGNVVDSTPGVSDLVDRLLLKGTATRNQEAIATEIDSLSLELDVDTRRDSSVMGAVMLPEDLDASLDLMADTVYHATLADYQKEKAMMAGEIQMELDSAQARASDLLIRTVFGGTPYGITSTVFLEAMERLDNLETLLDHYTNAYRPERMVVSVAGPTTLEEMAKKLEATFPKRASGSPLVVTDNTITELNKQTIPEIKTVNVVKDDSAQAHIYQAWIAPHLNHQSYYPLAVMNCLLGSAGLSSRLFLELRDKQGLAYTVRSSYEAYRYSGLLSLYIGTDPNNKEKCLNGFNEEIAKLCETAVSEQELAETKQNLMGRRTVFLETVTQWASYVGSSIAMGKTIDDLAKHEDRLMAVTAKDIQQAAQTLFKTPSVTSIVGPAHIFK